MAAFLEVLLIAVSVVPVEMIMAKLIREPDVDLVVLPRDSRGVEFRCFDNEDRFAAAGKDRDEKSLGITWSQEVREGKFAPVNASLVSRTETGKSTLSLGGREAAVSGRVRCDNAQDEYTWSVEPHFKLEAMPRSDYVYEGSNKWLRCKLRKASLRVPHSGLTFRWSRQGEHDEADAPRKELPGDGGRILVHHNESFGYSSLKIQGAVKADRAVYRCDAKLVRGHGQPVLRAFTRTLIRVKGRYAVVYPTIGIVAELFVLAVIIFYCEWKKDTPDTEIDEDKE